MSGARTNRLNCIIFDMDGTLVNSSSVKKKIWLDFICNFGYSRESVEKKYREYNGLPRRELINSILESLGAQPMNDDMYVAFNSYLKEQFSPQSVTLFPDTKPAINLLVKNGFDLFVSSGAPQCEVESIITCLGLAPLFKGVLGSDADFVKGKAHFDKILNITGSCKSELLFIGNDHKDHEIGTGYGIPSLIVDRVKNKSGLLGIVQDILVVREERLDRDGES